MSCLENLVSVCFAATMLTALSGPPICTSLANPAPGGNRNHHRNDPVQG